MALWPLSASPVSVSFYSPKSFVDMETTVANKIVFSPPFPPSIMDVARAMAPADFEFQVIAQDDPGFAQAVQDAEYFMGFPREHMGQTFYDMAPNLKLVQLISAGYDRLDVEAARQARVPILQQRRLQLGGRRRAHPDAHPGGVQAGRPRPHQRGQRQVAGGGFRRVAHLRAGRQDPRHRRLGHHRQEGGAPRPGIRHAGAVPRHHPPERGPGKTPSAFASCSSPNCCAPRTSSACTCR